MMYKNGTGVPKSDQEALFWWLKAAEQNFVEAQHWCGVSYGSGTGVPKDEQQAAYWHRKAAEQGLGINGDVPR